MIRFLLLAIAILVIENASATPVWKWECVNKTCQKLEIQTEKEIPNARSLASCRMTCLEAGGLWPLPKSITLGKQLLAVDASKIQVSTTRDGGGAAKLTNTASKMFIEDIMKKMPSHLTRKTDVPGKALQVFINLEDPDTQQLTLETDEGYTLTIAENEDGIINATIQADNFFGSRNALETLGQLIVYDDIQETLMVMDKVTIQDKPSFPYRGILLDTSRNYVSIDVIKRTINGMGASKLNTFHWHMTDSQSFPWISASHPELSQYGAYTSRKVYTPEDIADVIDFARTRGVRVLPEFDAPAHVGEGWQKTGLLVCFNAQPWQEFCVEPPCGQFDVTNETLYDVLEDLYRDLFTQFNPDIFHMGGDEVHFGCWNSSQKIVDWMQQRGWGRNTSDFAKLWDHFQSNALKRLDKVSNELQHREDIPIIMWTSTLTEKEWLTTYLPKDRYIIQIWTTATDQQVTDLLDAGYKVIISNYDALYLDCGFSGWVTDGNNWCSPYHGWQKVYENSPSLIAGDRSNQVLGSEATLWTEQVDSTSIDARLWPRAAAMAENLWTAPKTSWREAENRILIHRERLVERGIDADALEPEWCRQNQEQCPIGSKFNVAASVATNGAK